MPVQSAFLAAKASVVSFSDGMSSLKVAMIFSIILMIKDMAKAKMMITAHIAFLSLKEIPH